MPAGFQVFRDGGAYQIDGNYVNLSLQGKGSVTLSKDPYDSVYAEIPNVADDELVALRCIEPVAVMWKWGGTVHVRGIAGTSSPAEGAVVHYYKFKGGGTVSNFGLQVFNASGVLVYDSSRRLFNVVDFIAGGGGNNDTTKQLSSGQYAVIPQLQWWQVVREIQPVGTYYFKLAATYTDCVSVSSNGLISLKKQVLNLYFDGPNYGAPPVNWVDSPDNGLTSKYMILDVTDY